MLGDPETVVVNTINLFRSDPAEASIDLENHLENLPNNELSRIYAFSQKLGVQEKLNVLKTSYSLTKAAEAKLALILEGKEENETQKDARINKYVVGYDIIYEIYHKGTLEALSAEFMCSEQDPQLNNRETIFNPLLNFIGSAVEAIEETNQNHIVVLLADRVIEENNKPLNEQILDTINEFRKAPRRKIAELQELINPTQIKGKKEKPTPEFIESINEIITKINSLSKLELMVRSKDLDRVAENIFEKIIAKEIPDYSDEGKIVEIANNSIHNFARLHFYHMKNVFNTKEVINLMLANPKEKIEVLRNSRKLLYGKNMKYLGVHYQGLGEKSNNLILVGVDEFYVGSKKDYHTYFIEEFTRLRSNPQSFCSDLKAFKKNINVKTYKGKLIDEINNLTSEMKDMQPLCEVKNSLLLNRVAADYAYHYDGKCLYSEDKDSLIKRLSIEVEGVQQAALFVASYETRPENFLTYLLVGERDDEKKGRKALLSNELKHFGCFRGYCDNTKYSILILVDEYKERVKGSPAEELPLRINLIRNHPRTLIKYVKEYKNILKEKRNGLKEKKKNKEADELDEKVDFSKEICKFLLKTRLAKGLENSSELNIAVKAKIELNDSTPLQGNELKKFISEYTNNTFFSYMIIGDLADDDVYDDEDDHGNKVRNFCSGKFVAKFLIESKSMEILKQLFSYTYKIFNAVDDLSKNKLVMILADHAIEKKKVEVPMEMLVNTKRPLLTEDEIDQIRNDFNRLDILNNGYIRPDTILTFINNSNRFMHNNPIYTSAFQKLNTIENNEQGINVNQLMDAIQDEIKNFGSENWRNIYSLMLHDRIDKKFTKEFFLDTLKTINHKMSEVEASECFDRFSGEKNDIERKEFIKMMGMSEKGGLFADKDEYS